MNILITGGAGFVGSSLAKRLVKHHKVKVIDNLSYGYLSNVPEEAEFVHADINEDVSKHFQGIDVVFHFAAIAPLPDNQVRPDNAVKNNIEGTVKVLSHSRNHNVKQVIFASTSAIYENNHEKVMTENLPTCPDLIYATTKKCAELFCNSFSSCYGLPVTTLRFFNVYGPHQDFLRQHPPLMGYVVRELSQGKVPTLHADGEQRRDYVHVDDICNICELVILNPKSYGETFNVCSGFDYSVNEIYNICASHMNTEIKPSYREADKLWDAYSALFDGEYPIDRSRIEKETNKFCRGSFEKAKELLGWTPQIDFEKGVRDTVKKMILNLENQ